MVTIGEKTAMSGAPFEDKLFQVIKNKRKITLSQIPFRMKEGITIRCVNFKRTQTTAISEMTTAVINAKADAIEYSDILNAEMFSVPSGSAPRKLIKIDLKNRFMAEFIPNSNAFFLG
jgi:putative cell wall-binding protein